MKQLFRLSMFIFLLLAPILANADDTNGLKTRDAVIFNGGRPHKLIEVQPEGWYYYETQVLTIEFPVAGFEPYTLSVSSMYNTLDFYVTTPFTCTTARSRPAATPAPSSDFISRG